MPHGYSPPCRLIHSFGFSILNSAVCSERERLRPEGHHRDRRRQVTPELGIVAGRHPDPVVYRRDCLLAPIQRSVKVPAVSRDSSSAILTYALEVVEHADGRPVPMRVDRMPLRNSSFPRAFHLGAPRRELASISARMSYRFPDWWR